MVIAKTPVWSRISAYARSIEKITKMIEGTFSRKLDSMGRIMIPIRLRDRFGLVSGQEYNFTVLEHDGRVYIGIDCGASADHSALEDAIKLLEANGMSVSKA